MEEVRWKMFCNMYKVKNIRGTVFCAPVKFSKEIVVSLSELLNDYMPVLLHDSSLPFAPAWQIKH